MPDSNELSPSVIERLPRYYHYIQTQLSPRGQAVVSSAELAGILGIDDTLTRRDMSAIGVKGQPKIGFRCEDIETAIRKALGFGKRVRAVLVGSGRLGGALASYKGFAQYGMEIVAAFDKDPAKFGQELSGLTVRPLEQATEFIASRPVDIGILTVPADGAQDAADLLISAGIRVLWNFAPAHLKVPEGIKVRNELMSIGLAQLFYHVNRTRNGN